VTKVTHAISSVQLAKDVVDPVFLLTNGAGTHLTLGQNPTSRYQGGFFNHRFEVYKVIENLFPIGAGPVTELCNKFWTVERKRGKLMEKFFLPPGIPGMVYELSEEREIQIDLDCRKIRLGGGGDERWCVIQWAPPSATYQGDERLPFVLIVIRGAAGVYEDPSPKWFNKLMAGHRDDPRKMMIAMTEAKAAADIAWEKEADDMLEAPVEEATRAYANLTQDYKLKHIQVSVPGEREG